MAGRDDIGVVLATASPRRRRLFGWLGVPYSVTNVDISEDLGSWPTPDPQRLATILAAEKAMAARNLHRSGRRVTTLFAAFDTLVELAGELFGKPRDVPDAWRMLRALSGRTHHVVTGVALLCPDDETPRTCAVTTRVRMKRLSDEAIEAWMAAGEFMGCAGAYNIEGQVADVDVDECFQNVAGLPLCHVYAELTSGSVACAPRGLASPNAACDAALGRRCALGPSVVGRA